MTPSLSLPASDQASVPGLGIKYPLPPFMTGTSQQDYLRAEDGALEAFVQGYTHYYIDSSLPGERPGDWTPERLAYVSKLSSVLGVKPIYHGNFKSPIGSDVREISRLGLEYAKAEVDVCVGLGGAPLIVHGGGIVEPRKVRDARQAGLLNLVDNLAELVTYAQAKGVQVWLENLCNYDRFHPFYYICTQETEYQFVLDRVPGLRFILDVSHAHVNGGDPVRVFQRLYPRIAAMSFSDNGGERDSHLPLGQGNLDYAGLVRSITELGWHGVVGFETRGGTLAANLAYLNSLCAGQAATLSP
jgi:L-ribulose-5-phosphate 3-epimerase